jgi:hypothetical protein
MGVTVTLRDEEALAIIEKEIGDGDESGVLVKPSTLLRAFNKVIENRCWECQTEEENV